MGTLTPELINDAVARVTRAAERRVFADDATVTPEKKARVEKLAQEGLAVLSANLRAEGIDARFEARLIEEAA